MKMKITAVATALTLMFGVGIANASTYSGWKAQFSPALNKTITDYSQTINDLNSGYGGAAVADFNRLSNDAQSMYNLATSPDPTLNHDIRSFALSVSLVATSGKKVLNGTGSISQFQTYVKVMNLFAQKCTADIRRDNNRLI